MARRSKSSKRGPPPSAPSLPEATSDSFNSTSVSPSTREVVAVGHVDVVARVRERNGGTTLRWIGGFSYLVFAERGNEQCSNQTCPIHGSFTRRKHTRKARETDSKVSSGADLCAALIMLLAGLAILWSLRKITVYLWNSLLRREVAIEFIKVSTPKMNFTPLVESNSLEPVSINALAVDYGSSTGIFEVVALGRAHQPLDVVFKTPCSIKSLEMVAKNVSFQKYHLIIVGEEDLDNCQVGGAGITEGWISALQKGEELFEMLSGGFKGSMSKEAGADGTVVWSWEEISQGLD